MKNSKYFFGGLVLGILLLAAGCTSAPLAEQPDGVAIADAKTGTTPPTQTVDLSKSWWLNFTLPTGWVETTQLSGTDKPEYAPMTRDNHIVIVNTTKFFWPSSGRGPDWINQSDINNIADQSTATGITVSKITTDIPKTVKLISGNLYRDQVCNKGEDCEIGGSWIYVYYLKMPNGIFEAHVTGSDSSAKMVEVVEGILESAKAVDLASPANEVTDTTLESEDMTGWKTVITYPTNGSIIEGRTVKIKGTARPNSYIWAFVTTTPPGEREADRACLSGGVPGSDQGSNAQTDSNGNFEFTLKEPCSKNVWIYVASEDQGLGEVLYSTKGGWRGLCQSDSDRIDFTLSGELPASCK